MSPAAKRLLAPAERHVFDLVDRLVDNAVRAGDLLHELLQATSNPAVMRQLVICEGEARHLTREIARLLHSRHMLTFQPRQLHRVAVTVDSVVDQLEEVGDYWGRYRLEQPLEPVQRLAGMTLDSTRLVAEAWSRSRDLRSSELYVAGTRRLADEGEQLARRAGVELTRAGGDPLVGLRWKDILDRLAASLAALKAAAQAMQRLVEEAA